MELLETHGGFSCYPWTVTPTEYLMYAHEDIEVESNRSGINAIGNAKRAIHSHVDFLLHNCGRCLKKSSFPEKLELLNKLSVISPRILNKYNRLRNVIEHEYIQPTKEQVDEVIDVAELFVCATKCYTKPLPTSLAFYDFQTDVQCSISCNWGDREFQATVISHRKSRHKELDGSYMISASENEEQWVDWVSRILKATQDADDPYIRCIDLDDGGGAYISKNRFTKLHTPPRARTTRG